MPRAAAPTRAAPPQPPGHWWLGSIPALKENPLGFYMNCLERYGPLVRLRWGPSRTPHYLVFDPDAIEQILNRRARAYAKGRSYTRPFGLLLGEGVFSSDGDVWRRERKWVQPAFHPQRVAGFATLVAQATGRMEDLWRDRAGRGDATDLGADMTGLTLDIITEALFGTTLAGERDAFMRAVADGTRYVRYRITHPFALPLWVPVKRSRGFRAARDAIDRFLYRQIERQRGAPAVDTILSRLIASPDEESPGPRDDRRLRDELITLLLAGHETLASSLTWSLWLALQNPRAADRAQEELDAVLRGTPATAEDLPRLPWIRQMYDEALRLYPPFWSMRREALEDDVLGGYPIARGSVLILCPYVTHRHPAYWERPEAFEPERFSEDAVAGRHAYAYFPFGLGGRKCVGAPMALMEGPLILARMLQHFRLERADADPVAVDASAILRPRRPIRIRAVPR